MAELLSSKVIIQEEEPSIRSFPTLPTAVPGFLGVAERGPIGVATTLTSYEEYERTFGSYVNGYQLAQSVRGFFLNGGRQCSVVRTVHYTDYTDAATSTAVAATLTLQTGATSPSSAIITGTIGGPWALASGDTLVGSVEGDPNDTATFTAAAAEEETANAETYALSDSETLTVKIDQGSVQTITFLTGEFVAIGAATAEEVAAVINAKLSGGYATVTSAGTKVTIWSDTVGTGSYVEITGGTANSALGFPTSEIQGTGNVADISAVTAAEVKTVVEAAWTGGSGVTVTEITGGKVQIATVATGGTVTLQCIATSTADDELGLDNAEHTGGSGAAVDTLTLDGKTAGSYANDLRIKVTAATSGEASEFNLQVLKNSLPIESFANLTMDSTAARYVETVINGADSGSIYFAATDEAAAGTPTQRRPADVSSATPAGGDDGLTSLADTDFTGSESAPTGLYAFDYDEEITLLSVPDQVNYTVGKAMIEYCRSSKKGMCFAVLDIPAGYTSAQAITYKAYFDGELGANWGALYWPRWTILNPSTTVFGTGQTITVPTSGYICGIMARNDADMTEGPFHQPAGVTYGKPVGVIGLETDESKLEAKRDLVFPKRINPITSMKSYGIFVDGARTLLLDTNFPSVGERRGVSYIEMLLNIGLQWVRHRNHTPELRSDIERQVYKELVGWTQRGAFASTDPATAFFVDVSEALNPPSVVRSGQVKLRIGLATNTPAEFVVISITKDTRALEAELASA